MVYFISVHIWFIDGTIGASGLPLMGDQPFWYNSWFVLDLYMMITKQIDELRKGPMISTGTAWNQRIPIERPKKGSW